MFTLLMENKSDLIITMASEIFNEVFIMSNMLLHYCRLSNIFTKWIYGGIRFDQILFLNNCRLVKGGETAKEKKFASDFMILW